MFIDLVSNRLIPWYKSIIIFLHASYEIRLYLTSNTINKFIGLKASVKEYILFYICCENTSL
jgi:hypothetical protein